MAIKRSKADLNQVIRVANNSVKRLAHQLGLGDPGESLYLDRSAGGYRVTQATTGGGERDLSPRGTATEVALWMEGYIEGTEQAGLFARPESVGLKRNPKHKMGLRRNVEEGIRSYGPGKFFNVIDSYVYELSMTGADEELGEADGFGHYALVRLDGPDALEGIETEAEARGDALTEDERRYIKSSAGAILHTRSDGIVEAEYYDYKESLTEDWIKLEMEYEEFVGEEEEDY